MTTWCAITDVELILSEHGALSFSDDDEDGTDDAGVLQACIDRSAAMSIAPQICERYPNLALTQCEFLRWANAILAAFQLTLRRNLGPPSGLQSQAAQVNDLLQWIHQGRRKLPEVNEQFDWRPKVTNYNVQRGRKNNPVRSVTIESTTRPPTSSKIKTAPNFDGGLLK